ncbi:hypothetical protein ZIOFF_045609 [Zingiber officinale]|uniref:RING-type E3 ubiquitin transferase n=1 Tax=Zingiber officinale TaxID=94328 RepID=A0A8J5FXL5_ZINOF|nr:hypothetical protein ZIOFF_045609 [Zingiber officinale]
MILRAATRQVFAAAAVSFLCLACIILIKKKCFPSTRVAASRRQRRRFPNPDEHRAGPESTSQTSRGGLASAVIRCMPSFQYKEAITDGCGREIAECAICQFEYRKGEYLRRLPNCGHVFHVSCSDTWLRMNSTCPLCRTSVMYDAEESVSMMAQLERERPLGYRSGRSDETTHDPELGLEATTGNL